jgi:two-component system NtrC family sensor kinase
LAIAEESTELNQLRNEVATLRRNDQAQKRTIQVLMDRVEGRFDEESGIAVLQRSVALERIVQKRTEELATTNERLASALAQASRAEAEAASAQRLAAIGTLAAGVAHEINTPVQFVSDSLAFLREAATDVLEIIPAVRGLLGADREDPDAFSRATAEVEEALERADVDYLDENVPRAFERSQEGLERVASIVRSLKEFSHPGGKELSPADINRGIRNTVTIASNEYKYVADVETDLGSIPNVVCHQNDINQVVLNLLVNAAHACAAVPREPGSRGAIRIRTFQDGDAVVIEVSDDGIGIPKAIASRVFEPFFTTKGVGKGTGQGLSHAWMVVVERHGGALRFQANEPRGTVFSVSLPIRGPGEGVR